MNVIRYNILLLLVDCVWGAFGEWSDCSADCGTGIQTRTRTEETTKEHGGSACTGNATEIRNCNTHHCPGTMITLNYNRIYQDTIIMIIIPLQKYTLDISRLCMGCIW